MGCCASNTLDKNKQNSLKKHHKFPNVVVSKSPPTPEEEEEETVKQVLSETSKLKLKLKPETEISKDDKTAIRPILLKGAKSKTVHSKFSDYATEVDNKRALQEEISQVSEMYSLMQCNSNFTHNSHENNKSVISNHNVQLRNHARSPTRRYSGPGLGSDRIGLRKDVVRENSVWRSLSPASRVNVGRSRSTKRTGPSPGRVRMVHGPNDNMWRNENVNEWDGPKESLENPLVSFECFIFL